MEVGIRELKRRLSEYVEQAARGELIQVTNRGKPTAVLGPLPGRAGWSKASPRVGSDLVTATSPAPVVAGIGCVGRSPS